jgi:hypothetical protein
MGRTHVALANSLSALPPASRMIRDSRALDTFRENCEGMLAFIRR